MRRLDQKGVTLVELLIATGILAVIAASVIAARGFVAKQTVKNTEKAFATQKAVLMVEELKTLVAGEEKLGTSTLIDRADGATVYNPILSTDPAVTSPSDPLSQNRAWGKGWRFLRHIDIAGLPSDPNGSIVTIRVYTSSDGVTPNEELSTVTTVLRSIASSHVPTQMMDVYILAVANIPGWWVQLPSLRDTFQTVLDSLSVENQGLTIRSHFITRTSYGRDPYYTPLINTFQPQQTAMDWVYFYPGMVLDDSGTGNVIDYFTPDLLAQTGNVRVDSSVRYTSSLFSGCPSFATCDTYNNAMRYPDEVAAYQAVTQAAVAAGLSGYDVPEISLRMLMEGMYSNAAAFQNALVINLHGELLPSPAMRNYSDPAKDPANHPFQRVVTHPENLKYSSGANVNLRVYGYLDGLSDPTTLDNILTSSTTATAQTITVVLDQSINPAGIAVTAIWGSDSVSYGSARLTAQNSATINGMLWFANQTATQTIITLVNTPLRCPIYTGGGSGGGGLRAFCRLYGLEYIPCPIGTDFSQDLTDTSTANQHPKNTARWVLTVPGLSNGQHTIETRIGNYPSPAGTSLSDLSRTYVWVNSTPPITEQYQFVGDPRHCPYLDVKTSNGYNWFFRNIPTSGANNDGYSGYASNTWDGWGQDNDLRDIARMFQVYRRGLLKSHAIWSTMNGFSYYYVGSGGEFGSNQAPYSNGLSMVQQPWSATSNTIAAYVDEILPNHGTLQESRIIAQTDATANSGWYAKYWLGELYPDAFYPTWQSYGNIPTLSNANTFPGTARFYRPKYSFFGPYAYNGSASGNNGTGGNGNPTASGFANYSMTRSFSKRTNQQGCIGFFNGTNTANSAHTFRHDSGGENSPLQSLGTYCYPIFFFGLGDPVTCNRPWSLDLNASSSGNVPKEWSTAPYNASSDRTTLSVPVPTPGSTATPTSRVFYTSSMTNTSSPFAAPGTFTASGVIKQDLGTDSAFYIVSGLAIQTNFGPFELGKSALVFMLRTFLDGGLYTGTTHITQLPYVTLTNPAQAAQLSNPSSVPITYTSDWKRWNGIKYTEEYSNTYTETGVNVQFNVKYSKDDGKTWYFLDDTPAQWGVYDATHATTATNTSWDVSNTANFPRGNYSLRVEAFRPGLPLHFSFHETNIFINR